MDPIDPIPLPHDGPSDIALWRIDIDFTASLDAKAFHSLSDDERARARRFRRHEDVLRFVSVRAALREQLARCLGIAASAVRFSLDPDRRPYLANAAANFDFNVSHAGAHGLMAMSPDRRVGVDIEARSDQFDWRTIAGLTLDPDEQTWIGGLDAARQRAAFYDAWVAKEALLKTTGVGITRGLRHLTVLPREGNGITLRKQIPDDMRDVAAQWIVAPEDYAACLAWSSTVFSSR